MARSDLGIVGRTAHGAAARGLALAAAALLASQPAEAKMIGLELTGSHRPIRIHISNPQRTIQVTSAMKSMISVQVEDNAIISAYYVDDRDSNLENAYSLRFGNIGSGLVVNLGRALRSGCDRTFVEGFRTVSTDFSSRIVSIFDFRYFSIYCKSPDLKMRSIQQYCANIFALDADIQFGLISDFVNDPTLSPKNCVAKVKVAVS